jgi:putative Mn2+ efflux pump MntP
MAISMDVFTALFLNRFLKTAGIRLILQNIITIALAVSSFAIAGAYIGKFFGYLFTESGLILSSGILMMLGLKMITKSFKPRFDEMNFELAHPKTIFFFAIALSMNSFILGLALPAFDLSFFQIYKVFLLTFLLIGVIATSAGRMTDNYRIASRIEFLGGFILTGSAIYFLIKLFRIIT